jgi:hypothetical protein
MPSAPESTTTSVGLQAFPTGTTCTSSPASTLLAVVSARPFGPHRTTAVLGEACPANSNCTSSPTGAAVCATPSAPAMTHGVFAGGTPKTIPGA